MHPGCAGMSCGGHGGVSVHALVVLCNGVEVPVHKRNDTWPGLANRPGVDQCCSWKAFLLTGGGLSSGGSGGGQPHMQLCSCCLCL